MVTASNIVMIDLEGEKPARQRLAVNSAGFVIHSAILHGADDPTACVMHTHTTTAAEYRAWRKALSQRQF